MKTLTGKTKRILAAAGGAAIVLALLLAVDAVHGDPVSRAWARQAAIRYAEKRYPGQTFVPAGDSTYAWPLGYETWVQSAQSPDTCFPVRTRAWLFTGDDCLGTGQPSHVWFVEQKRNTCWRLEQEAADGLTAPAREQYGEDMALMEATACRLCEDNTLTAAEKTKALRELKAFVENAGWSADYYQVRFLCQGEDYYGLAEFAVSEAVPADDI